MGARVLNSDNEDIKQRVLSGETSISAGYKELIQVKSEEKENTTYVLIISCVKDLRCNLDVWECGGRIVWWVGI